MTVTVNTDTVAVALEVGSVRLYMTKSLNRDDIRNKDLGKNHRVCILSFKLAYSAKLSLIKTQWVVMDF